MALPVPRTPLTGALISSLRIESTARSFACHERSIACYASTDVYPRTLLYDYYYLDMISIFLIICMWFCSLSNVHAAAIRRSFTDVCV